ncbi:MAG TPA: DNA polymerase/3'-5' exonuclease PolX [Gemmatimonadota bacterium]|nr:DNA polymerase/3'-5' exonuclease PolX [Gemmatimonadota bacterium]
MRAAEVADVLEEIGRLLEFQGGNPFKARAYRNAAQTLRTIEEPLVDVVAEGRLRELPGIGPAIAQKIEQLAETGSIPLHQKLLAETPIGVLELIAVPGVGPVRARAAYDALGIASLDELEAAATSGRLTEVRGFGERTVATVLAGLARTREYSGRFLGYEARGVAELLLARLETNPAVVRAAVAGGLRRRMETVHDIDLVAAANDPTAVIDAFVSQPAVAEVTARGDTKVTVRMAAGLPADLRIVPPRAFPFALQYLTGSQAHNTRLRGIAKRKGLKLNEYGLSPIATDGDDSLDCPDEAAVYGALGLPCIPPELREDRGEIEAAQAGRLPELIEIEDLRGVVHCHTVWSDGRGTIAEMARAAGERGYEYLVVCDHSRSAAYAGGLTAADLARQRAEIRKVNAGDPGCTVLAGCEVDILADGSLDYPDEVLARLDCVVASLHSRLGLPREEQTARVLKALENPYLDMLGHPTGRVLLRREGADLDIERVLDAAAARGVLVEVNADPHRLDLDWRWHRAGVERGVRFSIDPDAHGPETIDLLEGGVAVARKGGLTAGDVVNAGSLAEFEAALRRNRD